MTEKARRKQFLNDFCKSLGVDRADSRRGQASKIYIEFGETQCRDWLARSNHSYRTWVSLVNKEKWARVAERKVVSKSVSRSGPKRRSLTTTRAQKPGLKSAIRRKRQPHDTRIPEEVKRETNLERHKAMVRRGQKKSLARAEKDRLKYGIRKDSSGRPRVGEGRRRRAHEKAIRSARIAAKTQFRDNVTPTVVRRNPEAELAECRRRLHDELSKGSRASQFLLAGLRARIAELSAETGTPKL